MVSFDTFALLTKTPKGLMLMLETALRRLLLIMRKV